MAFAPRNHLRRRDATGRITDDLEVAGEVIPLAEVDDRRTPDAFFWPLHAEHGFTVDVAASSANTRCRRYFDRERDGLARSWRGHVAWCNPPFSDLYTWTYKSLVEVAWGGCRKVVMLLPANRTEQRWWQDLIEPIRDRGLGVSTRNVRGRVKFHGPMGRIASKGSGSVPFGCVLVVIELPSRNMIMSNPTEDSCGGGAGSAGRSSLTIGPSGTGALPCSNGRPTGSVSVAASTDEATNNACTLPSNTNEQESK